MKPSSVINHLDEVIDEYLDLEYFADLSLQRLALGRKNKQPGEDPGQATGGVVSQGVRALQHPRSPALRELKPNSAQIA